MGGYYSFLYDNSKNNADTGRTIKEEMIWLNEFSSFLQMGERTIYKLAKQGGIPSFKVSNQWRFLKKDIDSWVEQKKSEVMGKTEKLLKKKD